MKPTKQPLVIEEGKDCERCHGKGKHSQKDGDDRVYFIRICKKCQGKGKSQNKLIFDAEDFRKPMGSDWVEGSTGLFLPKKGDYYCTKDGIFDKEPFNCNHELRLSSDAVLKSVGEMPIKWMDENEGWEMMSEHNLSENSKIVIATGYYE